MCYRVPLSSCKQFSFIFRGIDEEIGGPGLKSSGNLTVITWATLISKNTMFSGTPLFPSVYLYSFIVLKCLQEGGKLFGFFYKKRWSTFKKDKHSDDIPSAINVERSLVPHSRNISCQLWVCENVCKYYMKTITRIQNGCSPIGIMVWFQKAFCQTCLGLFVIFLSK